MASRVASVIYLQGESMGTWDLFAAEHPEAAEGLREYLAGSPDSWVVEVYDADPEGPAFDGPDPLASAWDVSEDFLTCVQVSVAAGSYAFDARSWARRRVLEVEAHVESDEDVEGHILVDSAEGEAEVWCPPAVVRRITSQWGSHGTS